MDTREKVTSTREPRWWEGITRYQWLVLAVAAVGWLFDTMDGNLFNLVRKVALTELVGADEATRYGGIITAIFLVGWSAGGFIFGILGDRIGRTRTMIFTILTYATFTGLGGLAQTWEQLALARFLTGLGVGGEWAAGAAIVAEVFPARSRPMALGTLQALSAVGNMIAAVVSFGLAGVSWRWVFAVGALPALVAIWVRRSIKEPDSWHQARAVAAIDVSRQLGAFGDLFRDPTLRRNTIVGTLMAIAGVGGLWGAAFWTPDLVQGVLSDLPEAQRRYYSSAAFFMRRGGGGHVRLRPLHRAHQPPLRLLCRLHPLFPGDPGHVPLHPQLSGCHDLVADPRLLHPGPVLRLHRLLPGAVPHPAPRHRLRLLL
jgi:MFS family permease